MHSLCCVFPRFLFQTMRFRCSFFAVCVLTIISASCLVGWTSVVVESRSHRFRQWVWLHYCITRSCYHCDVNVNWRYSMLLTELWSRQRSRETERARQIIRDEKHSVRWKQVVQWSNHHYMYYSMLSLSLRIVPTHIFPSGSVHCFSCKVHEWKVARTNEHLWRIRIRQNMRRGCQQRRRTTTLPRPNNKFDDFQRI